MISCIEWIPKGVADPTPKRYELSKAERELLESDVQDEDIALDTASYEEEMDHDDDPVEHNDTLGSEETSAAAIIASQPVDPSSLPEDLRMDEYSDDDSDDEARRRDIGSLLIGNESNSLGIDENGNIEEDEEEKDSEGEDDDLEDVPDTREYTPSDVKGLEAMSFAGYTGQAEYDIVEDDDEEDSDAEDINLRPDDALLVVAKTQEDFASLEITVFEESTGNLFVHHDIPLPAYPLCLAHGTINCDGGAGNYIAVGTFEPGIEIWNADVLNALEPMVILGGEDTSATDAKWAKSMGGKSRARPNMNQRNGLKVGSHTDAIMSLSWNTLHRQVIASGSADKTVKLWDITKAFDANNGVAATLTHHTDKVQSLAWHPTEGTILATGSYDKTVAIVDARTTSSFKKVKIPADCESIAWDPHNPHLLTAASEDGSVTCWDVRNFESGKPYWTFIAHEYGGCSDISYNPNIPGMLATCAIDKTVALWDTHNPNIHTSDFKPIPCGNKDMNVGKLYTISFYPSSPWLLGCGGSGNELALWNLASEDVFQKRFGDRIITTTTTIDEEAHSPQETEKLEDFEAIMAANDQAVAEAKIQAAEKKKKGGKSKKKVHKKR